MFTINIRCSIQISSGEVNSNNVIIIHYWISGCRFQGISELLAFHTLYSLWLCGPLPVLHLKFCLKMYFQMHFFSMFGSILSWFLYLGVYSEMWPVIKLGASENMAGQGVMLMSNPVFWFGVIIVPCIVLMRDVVWKM